MFSATLEFIFHILRKKSHVPTVGAIPVNTFGQYFNGEVSERLKEHAWKACVQQCTLGSNPSLSAIISGAFTSKRREGPFAVYSLKKQAR
jgi:hypothetical protein